MESISLNVYVSDYFHTHTTCTLINFCFIQDKDNSHEARLARKRARREKREKATKHKKAKLSSRGSLSASRPRDAPVPRRVETGATERGASAAEDRMFKKLCTVMEVKLVRPEPGFIFAAASCSI